jgi:hypothetical protein
MGWRPGFTEEEAREAIAASICYAEALRRLGLRAAGHNHRTIKKWAARWEIPVDHFDPDEARRRRARTTATPLEEVLVEHSNYHRGHLKRRLYEAGLKERACELCGQGEEWNGAVMALILDHVNGVADDNRLENLRIVCPNCAATLATHCGRKTRILRDPRPCKRCGEDFVPRYERQQYCSRECGQRWVGRDHLRRPRPERRRVEWPPYEQLIAELAASSYLAVGRKYGVSDNAVRKWVRSYERAGKEAA